MPGVTTERLRVALTPPQAATHTSAVLWRPDPDAGGPLLLLSHGAGTDLTHPLLRGLARVIAEGGHPVVTFNFPYAELGGKRPDPAARLELSYRDVASRVTDDLAGGRPVVLGGRSMGGRMASHLVADGYPAAGLVLLSYPLVPPGSKQLRTDHWPKINVPTLFVSGDRDRLCDLAVLERERSLLTGDSEVHVVAGGDHSFAVRVSDHRSSTEVLAEVAVTVSAWLHALGSKAAVR